MANSYGNVNSTSTPTVIWTSTGGTAGAPNSLVIRALTANSAEVFLGTDASVATTTGLPLAAGASIAFDLYGLDALYVVSAASQNVRFIVAHG